MSASQSDRDISKVGGRTDLDDDEDDEVKISGGSPSRDRGSTIDIDKNNNRKKKKKKKKQRSGYGCCNGDFVKAKKVVLLQFTKAKKYLKHRRTKSIKRPSSSENASTATNIGKRVVVGCCFCLKQPSTLESPAESQTSDPNDPNFTFDKLRTLIETNDFYSKECNHH
ncbi:hypothetical protein P3X46_005621 [Hevea brasiliensis]|uniref:Uncharacterized protein n=1 Tax=Hevea brasiliensis TaxID=3981 RepID=A0ABQ9N0J2_HEVBR|nr:hypothetical protein P3X46_005621 [Hevea brasiliensis]